MPKHNIPKLQGRIEELRNVSATAGNTNDLDELIKILHRPGWTTPAEFLLVDSIVESLLEQTRGVIALRGALLAGSREVQGELAAKA